MYKFSARSLRNLETCHPDLQELAHECIKHVDFSVIEGHRSRERQMELYNQGMSQLDGKTKLSKHNHSPSLAFDLLPYPAVLHGVNVWNDHDRFRHFAGFVRGVAAVKGINIRWGGDWNSDFSMEDTSFHDLPHFELI